MSNQTEKQFDSLDAEQFLSWLNMQVNRDEHQEKLREFFSKTKDLYSQCIGLEYLLMNGYRDDLVRLIEKNSQTQNCLNQEWASFYQLILETQKKSIIYEKFLLKVRNFKTDDVALQCMRLFMMISIHFRLYEYNSLANVLDELREKIGKVNHSVLEPLLQQRLELVLFNYFWKNNEMILARKHGFIALDLIKNPRYLANLHTNLGLSYIFDDFESARYHLLEGLKIAKSNNHQQLIKPIENHNLPFIHAHFNRPDGITTSVKSEQAHLAIARGEFKEAQELLSEVTEDTPFTNYYLGRAYQDRRLLLQSYNEFLEKRSDHFFARLPLTALQQL